MTIVINKLPSYDLLLYCWMNYYLIVVKIFELLLFVESQLCLIRNT